MNQYLKVTLVLLLAFSLRIGWSAYQGLDAPGFEPDTEAAQPHEIAVSLSSGNGFQIDGRPTARQTPVYPSFLAAIYYLAGPKIWLVKLIQAGLGTLTCLTVYFLAVEFFTVKVGFWAMLVSAVFPNFIISSSMLSGDTLFQFFIINFIFILVRLEENFSPMWLLLSGLILGVMVLTWPLIVFFPLFLLVWYLIFHHERLTGISTALVLGFCMILVMVPWTSRNYLKLETFIPLSSESGQTLYGGNNAEVYENIKTRGGWLRPQVRMRGLKEAEVNMKYWELTLKYWRDNPVQVLTALPYKFYRFWTPWPAGKPLLYQIVSLLSFTPILGLSVYYLVFLKDKEQEELLPVTGLIVYFTMFSLIVYGSTHFRFPIEALLIILATKAVIKEKSPGYRTRQTVFMNPMNEKIPSINSKANN